MASKFLLCPRSVRYSQCCLKKVAPKPSGPGIGVPMYRGQSFPSFSFGRSYYQCTPASKVHEPPAFNVGPEWIGFSYLVATMQLLNFANWETFSIIPPFFSSVLRNALKSPMTIQGSCSPPSSTRLGFTITSGVSLAESAWSFTSSAFSSLWKDLPTTSWTVGFSVV